jgi:prolyl oligopeptidase PreP (S9A serine peptidase family)
MKKIMKKSLRKTGIGLIIMAIVFASFPMATTNAASQLTNVKDTLTRLKAGQTLVTHTIVFTTPVDIDDNDKIEYDFSNITNGDLSAVVIGDLTFNDALDRNIAVEAAGTNNNDDEVVVDDVGNTITIHIDTSGTGVLIDATDTVTFTVTSRLTNAAAGLKTMKITVTDSDGSTVNADADLGIYFLSDDQVQISATVDPILAFAIEGQASRRKTGLRGNFICRPAG